MIDQPNLFDQPGPTLDAALALVRETILTVIREPVAQPVAGIAALTAAHRVLQALKDAGFHLSIDGISRGVDDDVVVVGHRHPATAKAMADKVLPRSGSFRRRLVERLYSLTPDGATDYELEVTFSKSHQAASGARSTLMSDGWVMALIVDGRILTRTNQYGNEATVWTITPAARTALRA